MRARQVAVPFDRSKPVRLPQHPDTRSRSWKTWAHSRPRPRAVDLFSGCGGLGLGLEQAGFDVILSVDSDPWALETHRHNLPGLALDLDLSKPDSINTIATLLEGIPIDLVAGGPPCQPFSRAGKSKIRSLIEQGVRPERDGRSELWQSFLQVVEHLRPRAIMMENVPDMALGDELALLRVIVSQLEEMGFAAEARLLDAWRYGVPQHRQRMILVGQRDGLPIRWPPPLSRSVSVRDAIDDLPPLRRSTGEVEMPAKLPRSRFQKQMRARMKRNPIVWDHVARAVREDDREAFRMLKPGMKYSDLPARLRRYRSDIFNDKYNRLAWDDVSRSITAHIAKDGYWYIHPGEPRTLTVREAARIQTFPDHFRFAGTRTHAFRQIGNAVPPALAAAVGRELLYRNPTRASDQTGNALARRALLKQRLEQWAKNDARNAPWRHACDPWSALVGVVLADRVGAADEEVRSFLKRYPRSRLVAKADLRAYALGLAPAQRKGIGRLAAAARVLGAHRDRTTQDWLDQIGLPPYQIALVRLIGFEDDRVVPTSSALRVLARLNGSPKSRLSDGRMELAQFVGVEKTRPVLNAALHALGRTICTTQAPRCSTCPLSGECRHER